MNSKKKWTIAYFNQTLADQWARLPWTGAVMEAQKQNINLIAFHGEAINDDVGLNAHSNIIYDLVRNSHIDGLITWNGHLTHQLADQEILEFFQSYHVPVITIEGAIDQFPCVTYGNYEGMKMNIRHLTEVHGFRKIAYLGLIDNHAGYNERYRGYRDGLSEAGIQLDSDLVRPWQPWIAEVDGVSTDKLLDRWIGECLSSGVENFIGACDAIAFWIIERLNVLGKKVPEDVTVCGFDGLEEYQQLVVPMTSVDPGWVNLGRTAVVKIIDLLEKREVEKLTIVPAKPRVAKTCGCLETNVMAADAAEGTVNVFSATSEKLSRSVSGILGKIPDIDHKSISKNLIKTFRTSARRKQNKSFIRFFDSVINMSGGNENVLAIWQEALTCLQTKIGGMFLTPGKLNRAYSLCNQARIAVTNSLQRQKNRELASLELQVLTEQKVGMELITTFDLEELSDILARYLKQLAITSCYLALYESPVRYRFPDPAPEWANLILAYKDHSIVRLSDSEKRIKSQSLIPERFINEASAGSFCVYPLLFREEQIGYIVYESDLLDPGTYNFISSQLSSALQGTLLINKINKHSHELENGIEDMSGAIEQMARNIETINENINNQSSSVTEEATAIEEMRSNIARITGLSETTADLSGNLDNAAQSGAGSVKELVLTIDEIQNKSKNISKLSSLIQEIADKTKLLAFNAAVEAVHAGEKGRGFSIVAKEIRKLAEDTENNIHNINIEIGNLLKAIQNSGSLTDQAMEKLENIIENSTHTNDLNIQLSLAMKEQDTGTIEIMETTQGLVSITAEINQSIQEQMIVTNEFKNALLKLKELI